VFFAACLLGEERQHHKTIFLRGLFMSNTDGTAPASTPSGWYADANPGFIRYWDGQAWTENVQPTPTEPVPAAAEFPVDPAAVAVAENPAVDAAFFGEPATVAPVAVEPVAQVPAVEPVTEASFFGEPVSVEPVAAVSIAPEPVVVAPTVVTTPAGWYPDSEPGYLRYWTGDAWTEDRQAIPSETPAPVLVEPVAEPAVEPAVSEPAVEVPTPVASPEPVHVEVPVAVLPGFTPAPASVEVVAAVVPEPVAAKAPAGWYPTSEPGVIRFWDGDGWTDHRQPVPPATEPVRTVVTETVPEPSAAFPAEENAELAAEPAGFAPAPWASAPAAEPAVAAFTSPPWATEVAPASVTAASTALVSAFTQPPNPFANLTPTTGPATTLQDRWANDGGDGAPLDEYSTASIAAAVAMSDSLERPTNRRNLVFTISKPRFGSLFVILAGLAIAAASYFYVNPYAHLMSLPDGEVRTDGVLVGTGLSSQGDCLPTAAFMVDGVSYFASPVERLTRCVIQEGATVPVAYNISDIAGSAVIADPQDSLTAPAVAGLGSAGVVLLAGLVMFGIGRQREPLLRPAVQQKPQKQTKAPKEQKPEREPKAPKEPKATKEPKPVKPPKAPKASKG
jgi:hypothetical protein